jgi:NADP-dependent 3-hydroxy acid dehydrogenase YdfG
MEAGHMHTFTSDDIFTKNPCLDPQDIADAVLYILGTPPHVQVSTTLHSLDRTQAKILLPLIYKV